MSDQTKKPPTSPPAVAVSTTTSPPPATANTSTSNTSSAFGRGFNFGSIGARLQEVTAKAAAQVTEMNTKVKEGFKAPTDGDVDGSFPTSGASSDQEEDDFVNNSPGHDAGGKSMAIGNLKIDTVDKKDLIEILQKMNQKVKALTTIRQQLTTKVDSLESEKGRLRSLIVDEILNGMTHLDSNKDEVAQLQKAWREIDEQNALTLQQLQSEFQSFRRQQQQQQQQDRVADDSTALLWQKEKDQLLVNHKKELDELRDSLTRTHEDQIQQIRAASQPTIASTTSTSPDLDAEIARIKEAAKAQLHAFKQKVAAARTAELDKIRQEMTAKAQIELETKLSEQRLSYEGRIEQIKLEVAQQEKQSWNDMESNRIAELQSGFELQLLKLRDDYATAHSTEIEKVRQEVEQTVTTDMEERLQELLGDLNRRHEQEIDRIRSESAQELAQVVQNTTGMEETSRIKQAQIMTLQQQLLESAKSHDVTYESMKDQFDSQRATYESKMVQLQSELEHATSTIHEKNQELAKVVQNTTGMEETSRIAKVQIMTLQQQLAELKKSHDVTGESMKDQLDSQRASNESKMVQLQTDLEHATSKIQEKNDLLTSMDVRQKELVAEMAALEAKHADVLNDMSTRLTEKENDLAKLSSSGHDAYADLQNRYNDLKASVQDKDRSLIEQNVAVSNLQTTLANTTQQLAELQTREQAKSAELHGYEQITVDLRNKLQQAAEELVTLSSSSTQANDLYTSLRLQCNELQASLQQKESALSTMTDLRLELEQQLSSLQQQFNQSQTTSENKILSMQNEFELSLSNVSAMLKETQTQLGQLSTSSDKANEAYAQLAADKEAEIAELKSSYETKLEEAAKKEVTIAQTFNKVKVAYGNKLKSTEAEFLEKIKQFEAEKTVLEETITELKQGSNSVEVDINSKMQELDASHTLAVENIMSSHATELAAQRDALQAQKQSIEADLTARMEEREKEFKDQLQLLEQKNGQDKETMRRAMEQHIDQMTGQFKMKLDSSREQVTALRDENVKLKGIADESQALQTDLKGQIDSLKKSLDEMESSSSQASASLLRKNDVLESERAELRNQVQKLEKDLRTKSNKADELMGKINALSTNLDSMAALRKEQEERLQQVSKQEVKLKESETEISTLREQVNRLKLDLTKNANLAERLQSEKEVNERTHGQRTALVGMLESQLSEMNDKNADLNAKLEAALYDLSRRDESIRGQEDNIQRLEAELLAASAATKKATEAVAVAQKGSDSKVSKVVEALQKELHLTKQQMARKSAAAQKLAQEREAECVELRQTIKTLQQEVDKGSLSDRRIFEFAAKQSNRESLQLSEIEIRDKMIDRMRTALLERDGDLASAEKTMREFQEQVEDLCRVRRREDVNLDYLKSVVVQYLSLPPGSSERARLLPVLATLLQFDSNDYHTIEDGKAKVSWWWGGVTPTFINAPIGESTTAVSAEVSVSHQNGASNKPSRTALQF